MAEDLTNVQKVRRNVDYELVKERYELGQHDLEELQIYEMMKRWYETKWSTIFTVKTERGFSR